MSIADGKAEAVAAPGSSVDPGALAEAIRRAGFTPRDLTFQATGRILRDDGGLRFKGREGREIALDPATLPAGIRLAPGSEYRLSAGWRGEAPGGTPPPAAILTLEPVRPQQP